MKTLYILLLCVGLSLSASISTLLASSKLSPELRDKIQRDQDFALELFVYLRPTPSEVLKYMSSTTFPNRETRLNEMHRLLVANTQSQQRLIEALKSSVTGKTHSFWITNALYLEACDLDCLLLIHETEGEGNLVEVVEADNSQTVGLTFDEKPAILQEDHQWGVAKIQAPEAWRHIGNATMSGNGVRIMTIDTGVRVTHEALINNYLGDYGWWDPSTSEPLPTDRNGHGTHTTGTIAGSHGIGVAPGAKWMACRGCATSACSQFDLTSCAEFAACPTLADGSNKDCTKAPHLVSNSWGGGRGTTWFSPLIDAWRAAGIIPVFSIGNSGPRCDTANSPGDNEKVIGVGSTTITDSISGFSSVGPTIDKRMKPDISAPGSDVVSAYNSGDTDYRSLSGTSMACPHTAGVVALLLTRDPAAEFDKVKDLLNGNTDKDLVFSGLVCENVGDDQFPNHVFGSGRLNALKSVVAQTEQLAGN